MMSNSSKRDPLELARQELDFAAIAATAPRCKDILYKAQTMVPMSPPRPWKRIGISAAAVLLVCILLAVPWFPQNSSLTLMRIGFEAQFDPQAAQELISHCLRELPSHALLGAEYDIAGGRLALRMSSMQHSPRQLQSSLHGVIDNYPGSFQPYNVHSGQTRLTNWTSPLMLATGLITGTENKAALCTDDPVACSVLTSVDVLASGVREQLNRAGYELTGFSFITPKTTSEVEYDFSVACWPYPVGISIAQYEFLSASSQLELRQRAEDVLTTANLRDTSLLLTDMPTTWMPLIVEVHDSGGHCDERLTAQAQAWIKQPTAEDMRSIDFDPQDRLVDALQIVLPNHEYRINYGQPIINPITPQYEITVVVTGRKAAAPKERGRLGTRATPDDEDLEY